MVRISQNRTRKSRHATVWFDRTLCTKLYGQSADSIAQHFRNSDFSALRYCPFVMGTMDDIDGRIGYAVLRKAGVDLPIIRSVSHNVGMLLTLCSKGIGACFCPENLAGAMLPQEERKKLLCFKLGDDAKYAIRFGYRKQSYQWSVISSFIEAAERSHLRKD